MDLFDRLRELVDKIGPLGVLAASVLVLSMMLMGIANKRTALLSMLLFTLMLSGCVIESVDIAGTLARWCIIFTLAMTAIHGFSWPGIGALMLGAYAAVAGAHIPLAPSPGYAAQFSVLMFFASVPMAGAIANYARDLNRIHLLLRIILLAASFYALVGVATLSSIRAGTRFSGASSSAALFVITGGLLLPVALWAAFNETTRMWRFFGIILVAIIAMLCLVSGQRTGTFAGIIACLPLLSRFGARRLVIGLMVATAAMVLVAAVLSQFPAQAEFVVERFGSADVTGREWRWKRALQLCLESPTIGHGPGASPRTGFGFHNAYLIAWYDAGIAGLLLFGGAYIAIALQTSSVAFGRRYPQHVQEIARLLLGQTLGLMAAGFFEGKTLSPSNIAIFFALLSSILSTRLRILSRQQRSSNSPNAQLVYPELNLPIQPTPLHPQS